ncbi:MAG TPA: hypothetical protein VFU10_08380 [Gaiellaceae bacterium]|nr:hypothetical protein [Gaiellaceae bacterium]
MSDVLPGGASQRRSSLGAESSARHPLDTVACAMHGARLLQVS